MRADASREMVGMTAQDAWWESTAKRPVGDTVFGRLVFGRVTRRAAGHASAPRPLETGAGFGIPGPEDEVVGRGVTDGLARRGGQSQTRVLTLALSRDAKRRRLQRLLARISDLDVVPSPIRVVVTP